MDNRVKNTLLYIENDYYYIQKNDIYSQIIEGEILNGIRNGNSLIYIYSSLISCSDNPNIIDKLFSVIFRLLISERKIIHNGCKYIVRV